MNHEIKKKMIQQTLKNPAKVYDCASALFELEFSQYSVRRTPQILVLELDRLSDRIRNLYPATLSGSSTGIKATSILDVP